MDDYGIFTRYDQSEIPGHRLREVRAVCIRNEAGQDYYELRNAILKEAPAPQTWLCVHPATGIIQVTAKTIDDVFPQDCRLVAIEPVADPKRIVGHILHEDGTISSPS